MRVLRLAIDGTVFLGLRRLGFRSSKYTRKENLRFVLANLTLNTSGARPCCCPGSATCSTDFTGIASRLWCELSATYSLSVHAHHEEPQDQRSLPEDAGGHIVGVQIVRERW